MGLLWHGLAQRRLCRNPGRFSSRVKRSHRRWARRCVIPVSPVNPESCGMSWTWMDGRYAALPGSLWFEAILWGVSVIKSTEYW